VTDNGTPTSRAIVAKAKSAGSGNSKPVRPGEEATQTAKNKTLKSVAGPARKPDGTTHPNYTVNLSGKRPEKAEHLGPRGRGR